MDELPVQLLCLLRIELLPALGTLESCVHLTVLMHGTGWVMSKSCMKWESPNGVEGKSIHLVSLENGLMLNRHRGDESQRTGR